MVRNLRMTGAGFGREAPLWDREASRPQGPSSDAMRGAVSGRLIGKTVIALVVFPLVGHAIYTMVSLVLGFMLPVILEQAKSWAQIVRKSLVIATILVAAPVPSACRQLWPTTAIRST